MENVLLIDYGSTYTKVVAVDTSKPDLLGCASAYTTIDTDVVKALRTRFQIWNSKSGKLNSTNA